MNKTAIEWCDYTWNPVTGCLHGCEYCYARGIVKRFTGGGYGRQAGMFIAKYKERAFVPPYELLAPQLAKTKDGWYRTAPYPFGFEPTFHRYRLDEPQKLKKPQNIFVCSMSDLFGDWVPDNWIQQVFEACEAAPWHRYLFLTKNPQRYNDLLRKRMLPISNNYLCGGTRTGQDSDREHEASMSGNTFLSVEPILAPMEPATLNAIDFWDWVIIGAETGNRKGKVTPERTWIENIVGACRVANVPVFMKNSLSCIWGKELIQEFPWNC